MAFCVPQYPEWGRLYALLALRNPSLPSACAAQHRRSRRPSPTYFLLSYRAFCAAAAAASAAPLNHSTAAPPPIPFYGDGDEICAEVLRKEVLFLAKLIYSSNVSFLLEGSIRLAHGHLILCQLSQRVPDLN